MLLPAHGASAMRERERCARSALSAHYIHDIYYSFRRHATPITITMGVTPCFRHYWLFAA